MALPTYGLISRGQQNTVDTSLTSGTALSTMVIRLFADFQKYLDPTETPFTSSLKTGKAVDQKKVEWGNSFLAPNTATLNEALDDSETGIDVSAGHGARFMLTEVIKIDSELMWVTAISTDTLTVTRGAFGSTAAAHSNGATIELLGPAAQENADTPLTPIAKGSLEYNYPQLFDYGLHLSERENNTPDYEFQRGTKYEAYLDKLMKEAAIDFEKSALMGRRAAETTAALPSSNGTPTSMGGLDFFTDREYTGGGGPITETRLLDVAQDLWTAVGEEKMAKTLLVNGPMKRILSSLWNVNRLADVKDDETNLTWKAIDTDFGKIRFVMSRYIPAGSIYWVNIQDITIHPYKNGAWKEVKLPSSGPYVKGRFTGDYTMVFRNNATRAKMTGFSTTATDYPNM